MLIKLSNFNSKSVGLFIKSVSPYKSSLDQFTDSDISPEAKENRETLLGSIFDTIVGDIAQNRSLSTNEVREAIDKSLLSPQEAIDRKLIDSEISPEELPQMLTSTKKPVRCLPFSTIPKATLIPPDPSWKQAVAVIPVVGMIVDGKSQESPDIYP